MTSADRRQFLIGSASLTALSAGGFLFSGPARSTERNKLPIPAEVRADAHGQVKLNVRSHTHRFLAGIDTPTFGINGPYLGPAVRLRKGEKVTMQVRNDLDQDITMHWHGLKIPGAVDGGPYNIIKPHTPWRANLEIAQAAATCWFHPHIYPTTAELVTKGLAGLLLIEDDEFESLPLPSQWGVDDIPVIIQDRHFNTDGSFFHRFNIAAVTVGYVGDTVLVNGANYPQAKTARGWIRLRLLNGSNARTYRLALSDSRSMFVVAGDGGFLEAPVELEELTVYSGERYEVLIDARNGKSFDLVTRPVDQLAMNLPPFDKELSVMTILPDGADGKGMLTEQLVRLEPLVTNLPPVSRKLVMGMNLDDQGMQSLRKAGLMAMDKSGKTDPDVVNRVRAVLYDQPALTLEQQLSANSVNGKPFELGVVPFGTLRNRNERWIISEGDDDMLHPVHIHGCQFRILSRNGKPPPPYMAGWKDMAPVDKGGNCEIQIRFEHPAPREFPFMAHCHNLEHEDSGMMTNFTVD